MTDKRRENTLKNRVLFMLALLLIISGGTVLADNDRWQKEMRSALPEYKVGIQELAPGNRAGLLSPDGRWTITTEERAVELDAGGTLPSMLYLRDRYGNFVRDLTGDKFYYVGGFTWSPTGKAIYFDVSALDKPEKQGLWKMELDTGSTYKVTLPWMPFNADRDLPIWSSTGESYIATYDENAADSGQAMYYSQGKTVVTEVPHRQQMNTESVLYYLVQPHSREQVIELGRGTHSLYWSPDERSIIYGRPSPSSRKHTNGSATELWIMDRNGLNKHPLITEAALVREAGKLGRPYAEMGGAVWLPDSKRFLLGYHLAGSDGGRDGLWVIDRYGHVLASATGIEIWTGSKNGLYFYVNDHHKTYLIELTNRR